MPLGFPPMEVALRLYVSERSPYSQRAIRAFAPLCRRLVELGGACDIVDVFERPELAEEDRILATPTLVRRRPGPEQRVIGELGALEELVLRLGLPPEVLDEARG